MISVHVDDEYTIGLLKKVYANKLNATSKRARFAMNSRKQAFKAAFRESAKVQGDPPVARFVMAVFHFCLPRCDWDAGIKSTQDAAEVYLDSKDDRVIKSACTFLSRPKRERNSPTGYAHGCEPFVHVDFFCMETELRQALERAQEVALWSRSVWQRR